MTAAPDIRVTILGSGTCVPSLQRSACAALIQTADFNLLLDAGPGTMHRLLAAGITVFDVTHVLFSHFHPDHTGEMATLLFANKYPDGHRRTRRLTLMGGAGFADFFHRMKGVYGEWIQLDPERFEIVELDNAAIGSRRCDGFTLTWGPVRHNPESTAYRVTGPAGRSVVYSGDTDRCDSLVELAQGADILVCESAMPDERKVPGHLTPSEAGAIASRAKVGRLVLTHLYPACDDVDIVRQCRRTWSGALTVASDLITLDTDGR